MIKFIFGFFAFMAFGYLCGAFVQADIDFRNWSVIARMFTVALSFFGAVMVLIALSPPSSRGAGRRAMPVKAERIF